MLNITKGQGLLLSAMLQIIFYGLMWLWNDYFGTILTSMMVPIMLGILIVTLIAEVLDRSKVPRVYFWHIGVSIVIPIAVAIFFYIAFDGEFYWLDELY